MTSHAEQPVSLESVLLLVNSRKVIPNSQQMRKSRIEEELKELLIRPLGGAVQAGVGIFDCCDGAKQQIAADCGRELAVLVQANGLIAAPNFASVGTCKHRKLKLNHRAGKRSWQGGTKRHDGEREGA